MALDLVIQGGALPTFLLDRCVAATGAKDVAPQPPQVTRLLDVARPADFDTALAPLLASERLDWAFVESGKRLPDFGLIAL